MSGYDGRPTDSQLERMARLQNELEAKQTEFEGKAKGMDRINQILAKRDLEPLSRLTQEEWQAHQEGTGGSSSGAGLVALGLMFGF